MPQFYRELWCRILHDDPTKSDFTYFQMDEVYARDTRYLTQVDFPANRVRKPGYKGSMWELDFFKPELLEWLDTHVKGIVFYNTREEWGRFDHTDFRRQERFLMTLYFEHEREALLFKMFWA